jgi:hypothetical protein
MYFDTVACETAQYFTRQLAERYLTGSLFHQILARVERLAWQPP